MKWRAPWSHVTAVGPATALAALTLLTGSSTASATVTIGQLPSTTPGGIGCGTGPYDEIQPTVIAGNSFVVPNTGGVISWTVTSWSHFAMAGSGQTLKMKIFRKVGEPSRYQVVAHDGPRNLAPSVINTFSTSLGVRAGDVLGVTDVNDSTVHTACTVPAPGETHLEGDAARDLADGESGNFVPTTDDRVNASAELTPTNTFNIAGKTRNKKTGTARVAVQVPNPGTLTATGNGVKAAGARTAVSVSGAGTVKLLIRAKGKKKRKLDETGKVKLKPKITYTPTGGGPSTQSTKLNLEKK